MLDRKKEFDYAYANNIDYVFNDEEYVLFLKSIVDYGIKDFTVITSAKYNFIIGFKLILRNFLNFPNSSKSQLWGYLRSISDHKRAFSESGFKFVKITNFGKDSLIIRGKL